MQLFMLVDNRATRKKDIVKQFDIKLSQNSVRISAVTVREIMR
jgi:hypothetical protein